jgi:hypothetical protein
MTGPAQPRRRGPTRWLLMLPLGALAAIIVGVVVLEALGPEGDPGDLAVEVPPLALEDETQCIRRHGDEGLENVREEFDEGGRVSSTQVYLCPAAFDDVAVTYVGEVVGELLPREGGVWAQVNDDAYALEHGPLVGHRERDGFNTGMPVWLPDGLHEEIDDVGRPARRGDVVLLQGRIRRADPDDGGTLTLRAESLEVLAASIDVEDPFHLPQAIVAAVLAVAAAGSVLWARRVRRR